MHVKSIVTSFKKDRRLFSQICTLVDADLSNPQTERNARKVLNQLRKKGYPIPTFDLDESDCISCLQLVLQSAADLMWIPNHLH
jgi:hypothetical protein